MAKNKETTQVQNPVLLDIGARDDVLMWRQQVGVFRQLRRPYTPITIGQVGQSDSGGIVALTITPEIAARLVGKTIGVAVQMEFKRPKRPPTEEQLGWGEEVAKRGGVFRVVRSAAEAREVIDAIQNGTAWDAPAS